MKYKLWFFSVLLLPSIVLSEAMLPKLNFNNMNVKKYDWQKETKHDAFCEKILSSLKSGGVDFLTPTIGAKSIENKSLVEKFGKCNVADLVTQYTFEPRVWEEFKDLPEKERNQYGTKYVKKGPFKVFEADVYGQSGYSAIIYGSCNMNVKKDNECKGNFTDFSVIDIKNCKVKNHLQVRDEDYSHIDVAVGVLAFEGSDYFYEASYYPKESEEYLKIYYWNFVKKRNRGFFQNKCTFSARR